MFQTPRDYLRRRALELGLDRGDALVLIQAELDRDYRGQARAVQLREDQLVLVTANAALASELRLRQIELIRRCNAASRHRIRRIKIQIR